MGTDGRGNATTNAYDTLGHLASVTDPLGATTRYAYDSIGNLVAVTNALGNATIYEYDIRGNKTYEGGATYPVRYTYDDFGNKTTMTTYRNESLQSGDTTIWLYDEPTGLLTNKVYADGKGPTYTYTIDGKLATRTWARGITTDYSYDGWGNLTNTVYSDGTPTISLFYDALGRQAEAHDAAGVTTFLYDAFDSLTNETVTSVAGINTFIRHWDEFDRTTGYTLNGTRQSTLAYDSATGRLATMLANGSNTPFTWSYLPGSDLKSSLAYPNNLTASWTYDANNQLLQICNAFPTNTISQYDYTYDAIGRRVEIARSGSAMSENRNDSYGYNIRNELVSATKNAENTEYQYQYDDIGNRISSFDLGTNRTYTANNLNQYTLISNLCDSASLRETFIPQFDDDGNQTLIKTATGIWSVSYNGENRPIFWQCVSPDANTQTLISMSYDRMGRRVSYLETRNSITNSNKVFTYDGYLQIANIELTTQNSQFFIWDATEPVATRPLVFYNSNAPPQYYTHDGNKNVSDLTDITQSLAAYYAYAPFGSLLSSSDISAITNPFRFSSEYADDTLGLVYYNYRHYNYLDGRWIYRDKVKGQPNDLSFDYIFLGNNHMFSAIDLLGLRTFRPHNAINHHFSFPARHYKKNPGNRKFRHTGNHSRLEPVLTTPSNKEDAIKSLGEAINKIVNKLFGPEHYSSPYQFIYDQYSDAYNEGLENCKTIERSLGNNSCRTSCEFSTPSKGPYISKSKCKCCEIAIIEKDWWLGDSGGRVYALGWAVYYENKSCDVVRKIPMIYPKSDRESVYITYISNF